MGQGIDCGGSCSWEQNAVDRAVIDKATAIGLFEEPDT